MDEASVHVFDPNWNTDNGGGGRGAQNHYALSHVDAIAASIRLSPLWPERGRVLAFMWATRSAWREGETQILARSLGLEICSDYVWAKIDDLTENVKDIIHDAVSGEGCGDHYDPVFKAIERGGVFASPGMMGLGFWSRSEHEYLLICRRGDIKVPEPAFRPRSMIYAPRVVDSDVDTSEQANNTVHSAKPERAWTQVIEPIARAVLPGVRGIEWNCRRRRKGWDAIGRGDPLPGPVRRRGIPFGIITGEESSPIVFEEGSD
jgi:hypothetical protein